MVRNYAPDRPTAKFAGFGKLVQSTGKLGSTQTHPAILSTTCRIASSATKDGDFWPAISPASAAKDSVAASLGTSWVRLHPRLVVGLPIPTPFMDVATHIVQAEVIAQ